MICESNTSLNNEMRWVWDYYYVMWVLWQRPQVEIGKASQWAKSDLIFQNQSEQNGPRTQRKCKYADWPIVSVVDFIIWSCSGATMVFGSSIPCSSTIFIFLFDKYRPTVNPRASNDPCCISRFCSEKKTNLQFIKSYILVSLKHYEQHSYI